MATTALGRLPSSTDGGRDLSRTGTCLVEVGAESRAAPDVHDRLSAHAQRNPGNGLRD